MNGLGCWPKVVLWERRGTGLAGEGGRDAGGLTAGGTSPGLWEGDPGADWGVAPLGGER